MLSRRAASGCEHVAESDLVYSRVVTQLGPVLWGLRCRLGSDLVWLAGRCLSVIRETSCFLCVYSSIFSVLSTRLHSAHRPFKESGEKPRSLRISWFLWLTEQQTDTRDTHHTYCWCYMCLQSSVIQNNHRSPAWRIFHFQKWIFPLVFTSLKLHFKCSASY